MINFLQELVDAGFSFDIKNPNIQCKAFKDNEGALEMVRLPKFRPRTKQYHHFNDSIDLGNISMHTIDTKEQQAYIFTKPLAKSLFLYI
jgi:hypothetical protein